MNSKVDFIDKMGSDLTVVNAARVSFDKISEWENPGGPLGYTLEDPRLKAADIKLIRYLALHNHWSPFAHAMIQFRVTAPVFVARQLVKHQVGLVWNEVSRRYVDDKPEFYLPESWRGRPINKKQGSSDLMIDVRQLDEIATLFPKTSEDIESVSSPEYICDSSQETYDEMIKLGVAPEQARMILPQNTMTTWIWSGSIYAFARIDSLRNKPDTQQETQDVAIQFGQKIKKYFPVSWHYLTNTQNINRLAIIKDFIKDNNLNGFDDIESEYNKLLNFEYPS